MVAAGLQLELHSIVQSVVLFTAKGNEATIVKGGRNHVTL